MGAPIRVVLDTNVVLSALVFGGGLAGRLRVAWQSQTLLPLTSTPTVQELMRVLAYPKFCLSGADQAELLADYLPYTLVIPVATTLHDIPQCRDPKDQMFLELAVSGQSEVLVSGDKDLLVLGRVFERDWRCAILSPEAFFNRCA